MNIHTDASMAYSSQLFRLNVTLYVVARALLLVYHVTMKYLYINVQPPSIHVCVCACVFTQPTSWSSAAACEQRPVAQDHSYTHSGQADQHGTRGPTRHPYVPGQPRDHTPALGQCQVMAAHSDSVRMRHKHGIMQRT